MYLPKEELTDGEIRLEQKQYFEADEHLGYVPSLYFHIVRVSDNTPVGSCNLRIGHNEKTFFGGNIGYEIEKAHRAHRYASKAVKLLFVLAGRIGMGYVIITCAPDNIASQKTCEYAGAVYLDTVKLPEDSVMYSKMRKESYRYIYKLHK